MQENTDITLRWLKQRNKAHVFKQNEKWRKSAITLYAILLQSDWNIILH